MLEETPLPYSHAQSRDANRGSIAFLERIQGLAGIRSIRSTAAPDGSGTGIVVYVHSRHNSESDKIYDALFEIEDLYPDAELNISISESEPPLTAATKTNNAASS